MNIRNNILVICAIVGMAGFFIGIAFLVASAINDDINVTPLFIGFAFLMICPVVGFALEIKLNKPKPGPAPDIGLSPAERMEGGVVLYCPLCHANLGARAPPKCPECGLKLR